MPLYKKLLLIAGIVAALALAILETVPRFVPVPGLRLAELDPYLEGAKNARVQPHPYLAYSPKPGFRFEGKNHRIEHNSLGFRGPEITWEKPPGTIRVACLGGSSTYGHGPSSNETTWPARLEHYLREARPELSIQVINGGCQGYSSFESLPNLAYRILPLEPDVVVVYQTINDMRCALYPDVQRDNTHWRAVWTQRTPSPLEKSYTYLIWRRYFTDYLRKQGDIGAYAIVNFDELVERDLYAWREGETDLALRGFARNLSSIVTLSESNGASVVLGKQALRRSDLNSAPSSADQLRCFDYMTEIVQLTADRHEVVLVDAQAPLEEEARRQVEAGAVEDDIFTHEVHVTDKGADRIAQLFAQGILEAGLLERAAAGDEGGGNR